MGHHERARERIGGLEVQVGGRILGVPDRDDVLAMASDGLEIGRGMALREDEQSDLSVTILPCNVEFLERSRDVVAVRGLGLDHDTLVRRGALPPELHDHVAHLAVADLACRRPAWCRDIAQTGDLGSQDVAHGVFEVTAVPANSVAEF